MGPLSRQYYSDCCDYTNHTVCLVATSVATDEPPSSPYNRATVVMHHQCPVCIHTVTYAVAVCTLTDGFVQSTSHDNNGRLHEVSR